MAINLGFLLAAIGRIRSSRYAGNRRASVRLPVSLPATLDGRPVRLLDLSLTGARATAAADAVPAPSPTPSPAMLDFDLHGMLFAFRTLPRRHAVRENGDVELGLEFAPDQEAEVARLAVAVFQGPAALEVVGAARARRRRPRAARAAA
jgi:hypothetical protein